MDPGYGTTNLCNLFRCADHLGLALQVSNNCIHSTVDTPTQVHGIHASGHRFAPFREYGSSEHCCSSGTCIQWIKSYPLIHGSMNIETHPYLYTDTGSATPLSYLKDNSNVSAFCPYIAVLDFPAALDSSSKKHRTQLQNLCEDRGQVNQQVKEIQAYFTKGCPSCSAKTSPSGSPNRRGLLGTT